MLKPSLTLTSTKNLKLRLLTLWPRLPRRPESQLLPEFITSRTWRAYSSVSFGDHTQKAARNNPRRRIRTLDPAKLTLDDHLDLSSMTYPSLRFVPRSAKSLPGDTPWTWRFAYIIKLGDMERFPPGTHGFMYYHVPPNSSPLAGELRFRITPSISPMDFAAGADLLIENDQPWRYPLYKIMMRPEASREITALLLQDQLVSQRTLDLAAAAALSLRSEKGVSGVGRRSSMVSAMPTLSTFGQEFTYRVRIDSTLHYLFVGSETIVRRAVTRPTQFRVWVDGMHVHYCPFEGTGSVCPPSILAHAYVVVIFIRDFDLLLRAIEAPGTRWKTCRRHPRQTLYRPHSTCPVARRMHVPRAAYAA